MTGALVRLKTMKIKLGQSSFAPRKAFARAHERPLQSPIFKVFHRSAKRNDN